MRKFTNWIFLAAALYGGASAQAQVQVLQSQVSSSSDDAEEDLSNNGIYMDSSDLELTTDGSTEQLVGIRFKNINIPAGSIIQDAYIEFTVDESTTSGNVDVAIAFEDVDNAAPI